MVAKQIVNTKLNGAVPIEYPDMIVVRCVDYKSDGNAKGYIEYKRTAKQNKPLMKGLSQEY